MLLLGLWRSALRVLVMSKAPGGFHFQRSDMTRRSSVYIGDQDASTEQYLGDLSPRTDGLHAALPVDWQLHEIRQFSTELDAAVYLFTCWREQNPDVRW
jgi:hypothetical protein